MAKTLRASVSGLQQVDRARRQKGWNKNDQAWIDLVPTSRATLKRFWGGKAIDRDTFIAICREVGLSDWEAIADFSEPTSEPTGDGMPDRPPLHFSAYNPVTWVGRDEELATLQGAVARDCRVLAVVGMTGIGKTALVECLVAGLDDGRRYCRLNLDDRGLGADFYSGGAALLRQLGEVPSLADQQDPNHLAEQLLGLLRSGAWRVQIDSLERLLVGDEAQGWHGFADPLWEDWLQQLLAGPDCGSQVVLTTQALPESLTVIGSRYRNFWHCQPLRGLDGAAQLALFERFGVAVAGQEALLQRLGALYEGHPLVLQVMAAEMVADFGGEVSRYWQRYGAEFGPLEGAGAGRRSRRLQLEARERVKASLLGLAAGALRLLCRCAVWRLPVPEGFWLGMLKDEGSAVVALDLLRGRALVEEGPSPSGRGVGGEGGEGLRLHNLVRQVAYGLLQRDPAEWQVAHGQAAQLWLTAYEPDPGAERLEQVRGYLEAFHHYCELPDWEKASELFMKQLDTGHEKSRLEWKLFGWGYYREQIELCSRILDKSTTEVDQISLNSLGSASLYLSEYKKAIDFYQKSFEISQKTFDSNGESISLANIGVVFSYLGEYQHAINFYMKALNVSREVRDLYREGSILGNLANAYSHLSKYQQATSYYMKGLAIAQKINNHYSECRILGNLEGTYFAIGNYQKAIDYYQNSFVISKAISDRLQEGTISRNLGITYYEIGKYKEGIEYLKGALVIARKIGDLCGEGSALLGLGFACRSLGDYHQAISYCQKALVIARKIADQRSEGYALGGLGTANSELGNYQLAIDYHQQYLEITRKIRDRRGEGTALGNLGLAYAALGNYQQAIDYHLQALAIAREIGDRRGEGIGLENFGGTLIKLERYSEAKECLQNALEIDQQIDFQSGIAETLKKFAELHQALGEVDVAQQYCQQALTLATELSIPLVQECESLLQQLENSGGGHEI